MGRLGGGGGGLINGILQCAFFPIVPSFGHGP